MTCTGGERGSILNPKLQRDRDIEENIHEVRRKEMDEAREILGVKQDWLGFVDSGLPEGDPLPPLPEGCFALEDVDKAAGALVEQIRSFRPQVITTYDENGGYPHPDHIMTHKISMVAFEAARRPGPVPGGAASRSSRRSSTTTRASTGRARGAAQGDPGARAGVAVRGLARELEADPSGTERGSPRMCRARSSSRSVTRPCSRTPPRSTPTAAGSAVPLEIQQEVWPTEEYELVTSYVPVPEAEKREETDLFAGLDVSTADDEGKAAVGREISFGKVVTA